MKEIKFRAWHKNIKTMCENVKTDLLDREYLEFMQYTGMKDRNGKEVYEGDIIPYHFDEDVEGVVRCGEYSNPCDDIHGLHIGFYVEFNNEYYKNMMRKDLGYWLKVSEVVGHIYEN